jgi:predicted permease
MSRWAKWSSLFFSQLALFTARIVLPIFFFVRISRSNPADLLTAGIFPIAAVLIVSFVLILALLYFRLIRLEKGKMRVGLALAAFGNSGYITVTLAEIVPATLPLFGESLGVRLPHLYIGAYLLVFSPLLWTLGNRLVAGGTRSVDSGPEGRQRAAPNKGRYSRNIRSIVTPPFLGITAGLAVAFTGAGSLFLEPGLPLYALFRAMERVAELALPLVMIYLGSTIGNLSFKKLKKERIVPTLLGVIVLRYLLLPLLFFVLYTFVLRKMDLAPAAVWVLFLETHLPPASSLSLMATEEGETRDLISFVLLVTYLLYLVLLPVYLLLFINLAGVLPTEA